MSIVASIRSQLVPVNQEGYPFIATFGIAKPDAVPICQAHLAGVPDVCSLNTMPTGPRASSFALRSPSGSDRTREKELKPVALPDRVLP
jgi:hypothetical protein